MRYFYRKNKSPKSFQAFSWNFLKNYKLQSRWKLTSMWFEHATFWSGVRRAIVAPRSPGENWAVRLKDRVFSFQFLFVCLLNVSMFPWTDEVLLETKKSRSSFHAFSLFSWKKNYTNSKAGEYWLWRDSNTQPSKNRAIRLYRWVFFLPATIFCALKLLIYPWNEVLLLEKQIPKNFQAFSEIL